MRGRLPPLVACGYRCGRQLRSYRAGPICRVCLRERAADRHPELEARAAQRAAELSSTPAPTYDAPADPFAGIGTQ